MPRPLTVVLALTLAAGSMSVLPAAAGEHAGGRRPVSLGADGTGSGQRSRVGGPEVVVNRDRRAAPQDEPAVAVDPNDPQRVVVGANDYVTWTWSCHRQGDPCSALGGSTVGSYYSADGGRSWCCSSRGPRHPGTLLPGVTDLTGGPYRFAGDPSLAFDSRGRVYAGGVAYSPTAPASSTVLVLRGEFPGGRLRWHRPVLVHPVRSGSDFDDKPWVAADAHPGSRWRDRVYVVWNEYLSTPGAPTRSPVYFAFSTDGGRSFSARRVVSGSATNGSGARPVVAPDGSLYIVWEDAASRHGLGTEYVVASRDGGATFTAPGAVASVSDPSALSDTEFRTNAQPAVAVDRRGALYLVWSSWTRLGRTAYRAFCPPYAPATSCWSQTVYAVSRDGGRTWTPPRRVPGTTGNRFARGYPVHQHDGTVLPAPPARPADSIFPAAAADPTGGVYLGAYVARRVSPWRSCARYDASELRCLTPGRWVDNALLDYVVARPDGTSLAVNTTPINSRYQFGGGFLGDYTDLAIGADGVAHPVWTDTAIVQPVDWYQAYDFTTCGLTSRTSRPAGCAPNLVAGGHTGTGGAVTLPVAVSERPVVSGAQA